MRVLLGLWSALAMSAALAQAGQWGMPVAYTSPHNLPELSYNPFEFRGELNVVRYDFSPISLAELGDASKRFEVQTSGALAVVYPDIGEPYPDVSPLFPAPIVAST